MLSFISCTAILLSYFSLLLSHSSSTRTTTSSIDANEIDRLALLAIKSQLYDPLGVTNSWNDSVPLCLWTGVTCGHQHQRVTKLGLSNQKIGGRLSPFIGNLSFLRSMHLEDNNFYCEIPREIGLLFRLKHLVISNNSFFGTIPANLSQCSKLITFVADHNNLMGEIPMEIGYLVKLENFSVGRNQLIGQLPPSIGNLSALQVISLEENNLSGSIPDTLGQLKRRRRANKSSRMWRIEGQFPVVTYAELKKATNEFSSSHMIGQGSYGIVYKGDLGKNGMLVAVKVINLHQKGASKCFISECEALKVIRHRNLIKILTVCSSMDFKGDDFKALVYEYMQNKSLEEWLHPSNDQLDMISSLSLIQRLNISIDVAFAIEYLHHHCEPPIIHGDLKPSNVLLDHDMVAHVGDFGLAKFLSDYSLNNASGSQTSSIGIKGTVGYIAPEYGMGSKLSLSGDIYSFGILLLEMFTRKRPTNIMFNDGLTLHEFVRIALPVRAMEIVEPSLLLEERTNDNKVENLARHEEVRGRIEECLFGVLSIGILCSMECPAERMEMTEVVAKLHAVSENFRSSRI